MKHQKYDTLLTTALRKELKVMDVNLYAMERINGLAEKKNKPDH